MDGVQLTCYFVSNRSAVKRHYQNRDLLNAHFMCWFWPFFYGRGWWTINKYKCGRPQRVPCNIKRLIGFAVWNLGTQSRGVEATLRYIYVLWLTDTANEVCLLSRCHLLPEKQTMLGGGMNFGPQNQLCKKWHISLFSINQFNCNYEPYLLPCLEETSVTPGDPLAGLGLCMGQCLTQESSWEVPFISTWFPNRLQ